MTKVFLDTDVLIDVLIDRKPYSNSAAILLSHSELGVIECCISSLSVSNMYYVIRKIKGDKITRKLLQNLLQVVTVLPVYDLDIIQAIDSEIGDFEDAIQNSIAQTHNISTIVTRNIKDYKKSDLAIHTPMSFLKLFQ